MLEKKVITTTTFNGGIWFANSERVYKLEDGAPAWVEGLFQERRYSVANALELRLSCTNSSKLFLSPIRQRVVW